MMLLIISAACIFAFQLLRLFLFIHLEIHSVCMDEWPVLGHERNLVRVSGA